MSHADIGRVRDLLTVTSGATCRVLVGPEPERTFLTNWTLLYLPVPHESPEWQKAERIFSIIACNIFIIFEVFLQTITGAPILFSKGTKNR